MKRYALLIAALVALCGLTDTAEAQRRAPGFTSAPAVNPWVLARGNSGGGGAVGTYFSFVRPMSRMQDFVSRTDRNFMYQQQQLAYEQREMNQMLRADATMLQMRPTTQTGMTSRAGSFMNYSRFYPQANPVPVRR